MTKDLIASASTPEKWGEPNYDNLAYIHNLQYLNGLIQTNPSVLIGFILDKFPKIPPRVLETLFIRPDGTVPVIPSISSPEPVRHRAARCFTPFQIDVMKRRFEVSPYVTQRECDQLATSVGLRSEQVKQWFNSEKHRIRKAKEKKDREEEINDGGVRLSF
ncbi:hypothetical protein CAEBREN_25812 [Caenorhabditis brenneri]|uniref:Homeobox domain-containing protein n=1 Tax=Caenorhabditis brenneri TaxID=135651 RepID=G0NF50_CAEBE|nr:hypothetical protein CAEBREN_25812 [Caenorhabditis brenneri]